VPRRSPAPAATQRAHRLPVGRFWRPEEFAELAEAGRAAGMPRVAAGPLVRSSYRARELGNW